MPPVPWPTDPSAAIVAFGKRHPDPEAGALLSWALSSVEALHYLADLDDAYDVSRTAPGGHPPDIVDVAHARWATGTCITALDLCAAGLARALGGHPGPKEFDLGNFSDHKPSKATAAVISTITSPAINWIQGVLADPAFDEMKAARDALTHRRLPRHFYASVGTTAPNQRLDLEIGTKRIPVWQLVKDARDLATKHLSCLLTLMPAL